MRNFAIIGLGDLGKCMLQGLAKRKLEVIVIDSDEQKVQWARDLATTAAKADALDFEVLQELFPQNVHCAVVDLGSHALERSILVTNYLHKLGVENIVVHAVSREHAEILEIVGATQVIFPEEEAAKRLVGLLAGQGMLDFFPVSEGFSLIEVSVPTPWVGRTLMELEVRKQHQLNVVALRQNLPDKDPEHWSFPDPKHRFKKMDIVLLAGNTKDLERVTK